VFTYPTNNILTTIETTPFTLQCQAMDTNSPPIPLTYSMVTNVWPTNLLNVLDTNLMTIDPNSGVINWTPDEAQGPTTNNIAVRVSNGFNAVTNYFTVVVVESNLPPFWPTNIPSQTNYFINAQSMLSVVDTASDLDIPTNLLAYLLLSPTGVTNAFIDTNGIFHWTPTVAQAGTNYIFTNIVTDTNPWAVNQQSFSVTNSFMVTVLAPLSLTNGLALTNIIGAGGIDWITVNVPINAYWATNTLFFATNLPVNIWFSTNFPPTITNINDSLLMFGATNGISILGTNTVPTNIVAGGTYYLGVQNTNSVDVGYGIGVDFATNFIVINPPPITNGVPLTNIVNPGSIDWFTVNVPTNATAATNILLFATNLPVNVWFSTNVPPTITNANDVLLMPVATNGISVLTLNSAPTNIVPGGIYYLGVQNTNGVAVGYGLEVNFATNFIVINPPPITNGVPLTNIVNPGSIDWFAVNVPTNAIAATNILLYATNLPVNVWFSTNAPPTITNADDVLLMPNATNGISVLTLTSVPTNIVPGGIYYLGVQNTNGVAVGYGLEVDFLLTVSTNTIRISSITYTNIGGTNGFLLVWFAPSNDLFEVQQTADLTPPIAWNTFTNIISFTAPTSTNGIGRFEFFDDGSQFPFGPTRFYRLLLLQTTNTLTLPEQTNYVANVSQPLAVTNTATDSDTGATLIYQLANFPTPSVAAAIDSNGIISWTPGTNDASGAFKFITTVTDNGLPPATATNAFTVFVLPPPSFSSAIATLTNVTLQWSAPSNDLFEVAWTTNLSSPTNWTLFSNNVMPEVILSPDGAFTFTDTNELLTTKFYRLVWLPFP
jgi:hypothetical protein